VDDYGFANFAAAVSGCFYLNRDLALAAGGDQPRGRGCRAPSPGFDIFNFEVRVALVKQDEIMPYDIAFDSRTETVLRLRKDRRGSAGLRCGGKKSKQKEGSH
jgi:hypothetical protein